MIGRRDLFFSYPLYFFQYSRLPSYPSSSVSLSYFILAVFMRECLGKHSWMSSQFPIAILNGTFFLTAQPHMHTRRSRRDRPLGWWLSNLLLLIIIICEFHLHWFRHKLLCDFCYVKVSKTYYKQYIRKSIQSMCYINKYSFKLMKLVEI